MSSDSLFSTQWHRVRHVCPRLASDVTVSRHVYRGRTAFAMHRRATTAVHRLDTKSFELVDRLDGEISVGEIWERAIVERDQNAPTQDEWIALLSELHAAELIVVDRRVPEERLFEQRQRHRVNDRKQRYLNPLYLRFALHDPDSWLSELVPLSRQLFSRRACLIWLLLMTWAAILIVVNGEQLWKDLTDSAVLNTRNAVLFFLIYPPLKLIHEFAHALAVKRAGGEVHETGFALMVFLPLPYVDASASAMFADKYDRMLVSAAGIIVELACAAVGVLLWANTTGSLQHVGLVMFMVGSISTLLLNGNPLLKFDGYYVLADWIEIPNLAARSRRTVLTRLKSFVTGDKEALRSEEDLAEKVWLHTYGVCSGIYRTGLMLTIAWMLSDRWFFLGVVLAIIVVILAVALPTWRLIGELLKNPIYRSGRSILLTAGLPLALLIVAFSMPLPHSNVVPGVVWIPDQAVIRAQSDCDIVEVFVTPGSQVKAGDKLYSCEELDAEPRLAELVAHVDELMARRASAVARDPLSLNTLDAELKASTAVLEDARQRLDQRVVRAGVDGLFDVSDTSMLEGRSAARGDVIAYVIPPAQRTVRMAIDDRWISRFTNDLQSIALRVSAADGRSHVHETSVLQRTPKATRVVASAALSSRGGGLYAADENGDGRLLQEAVFDVELDWPEAAGAAAVGSHVDVRLVYNSSPLSDRLNTSLQQAFTQRID